MFRLLTILGMLIAPVASAQEAKSEAEGVVVPFRLSRTQHIVVRVKIDGKGPFQFVVDTGCPALVISTEAAKKAGLVDVKGVGVIKKLDFEGGLSQENVKARIETPFQIEGMNSMGLPGVELHGLMGYTVLAKYKMEIDLAKERMIWTPLPFDPPGLEKLAIKKGDAMGIELMGGLMKVLTKLTGLKPAPPASPRGFAGVVFDDGSKDATVALVFDDSPAAKAGLKAGDVVAEINGEKVATRAAAMTAVAELRSGAEVAAVVVRGGEKVNLKWKMAGGI